MLTLITGCCGSGKSVTLMEHIRRVLSKGEEVWVLVPEQFSFEAEKRLYRSLGAVDFNRLRTFSFATLSRYILERCREKGEQHASDQQKLLCLYRAVQNMQRRGDLTVLEKRSRTPDFTAALLPVFTKCRKAGISSQQLLDTLPLLPDKLHDKMQDLGLLLLEYDRVLQEKGLYDGLVDLTEAALLANTHDFFVHKHIFLDEFDSFTGDQYALLEVMFAQASSVTAAVRQNGEQSRFHPVYGGNYRTCLRLKQESGKYGTVEEVFCGSYRRSAKRDLAAVSGQTLQACITPAPFEGNVQIFAAKDPIGEAEYICATICRMLSEDGTLCCRDIAVVVSGEDTQALERSMVRYGLPFDRTGHKPILHTGLIRHFLALLELISLENLRTESVLRYLKTPFSGYSPVAVSMLEHFCFTWDVDGEDWLCPFGEDAEKKERMEAFGGDALERTRESIVAQITALRDSCTGQDVRTVCTALFAHLDHHKASVEAALEQEPTLEQREFVTLWNLLSETAETVVSCLGDEIIPPGELMQLFYSLLSIKTFATPPQTIDSIRIIPASTAILDDPRVLFVTGANENAFPGAIVSDGLLTQQELDTLHENGLAISRLFEELCSNEKLTAVKILSSPTEHLMLSFPEHGPDGGNLRPSPIIAQLGEMFPEAPTLLVHEHAVPLSYYVRTREAAYFHYVRHMQEDTGETAALREILMEDPVYAARLSRLTTASSPSGHVVSASTMETFLGSPLVLSASRLETFYSCPFQYFCAYCLELYIPQKAALDPRSSGTFSHYCLEQILCSRSMEEFLRMTPEQLAAEIRQLSEIFSKASFSGSVLRDGRFQMNYRMQGRGLLEALLHMQREMGEGRFMPAAFEMQIGGSAVPPLSLRDGSILCKGKIDRVDICRSGDMSLVRVVDYKTGEKSFSLPHLARGLDMQMLLYLFALENTPAFGKTLPGGVMYLPSGQLKRKEYESRGKSKKTAQETTDSHYRMQGVLLEDALSGMEPEARAFSRPITDIYDTGNLFAVSGSQMQQLRQLVEQKICNMADELHRGSFTPAPFVEEERSTCQYCACADLCGHAAEPAAPPEEGTRKERAAAEKKRALDAIFGTQEAEETIRSKEET